MTIYRMLGIVLLICAFLGYIFVADELRHLGELLGVTSILFAGLILLLIDTKWYFFKRFAIQWISLGFLFSIPIGGVVLDNMPLGIAICFAIGLVLSYVLGGKGYKT